MKTNNNNLHIATNHRCGIVISALDFLYIH